MGGHAWIIPSVNDAVGHQGFEPTFRGNGVGQLETGKFALLGGRAIQRQVGEEPVIERTMTVELQGAQ